MNNKRIWLFLLLLLSIQLTACSPDKRVLEKTGFIHSLSLDAAEEEDDRIQLALSLPSTDPDRDDFSILLSTVAKGSKEGRAKLSRETNLILANGQLRTVLFGISLAEQGIWKRMDTFYRDPTVPNRSKIVIINGNAKSLLSKKYKEHPRTNVYIDKLIEKESRRHTIPGTTLYSFSRDYYDDGIDPVVPVLKDNGDDIIVDGIGIFKDDQYVAKIPAQHSLVFSMLTGKVDGGELSIDLSGKDIDSEHIVLSAVTSSRKVQVQHGNNRPLQIELRVEANASIMEYTGELELDDDADRRLLEQTVSESLSERADEIVQLMKKHQSDNIGVGSYVRNSMSYSSWKELDWPNTLPDINVNSRIQLTFNNRGFRY